MEVSELISLIQAGKSQSLEILSRASDEGALARVISSFANSGGGYLVVGVDTGGVTGLSSHDVVVTAARLESISNALLPDPISLESKDLGGLAVVVATIPAVPNELGPVRTADGGIYRRDGQRIYHVAPGDLTDARADNLDGRKATIFVAMSFRFEEEPTLVDHYEAIRRAVAATGLPLTIRRIDLIEGDYEIMSRTEEEIDAADVVIADFTLNSLNVYYEAGIARALNKYIIRCARKGTPLPFDLRQYRTHFFANATQLEAAMKPAIQEGYASLTA